MRRLVVLTVLLAGLTAPGAAQAGPLVDRAVDALRETSVYVDPEAEPSISTTEAARLRDRISQAGTGPVYIALLPGGARDEAGGDATALLGLIHEQLGREGTYALVAGGQFRAGSTSRRDADDLATAAFRAAGDEGVSATLTAWVQALGGEGPAVASRDGGDGDATGLLVVLGVVGGGAALAVTASRRRRRRETEHQVAELREAAHDDLVALGDDVRAVDIDVEMPDADPRAREELGRALAAYEEAESALGRARSPQEFEHITSTIEEGRYAMVACRARLAGDEPPERRPPCFFDPRHGPSVTDVEWAPDGYSPRPVPVCAADAARLSDGVDPDIRHVLAGGERVPLHQAPAYFGPYAGGFFGGGSLLLPGLLFGGLIGSSMFASSAWAAGEGFDGAGGGFDVGGGGDFGGFGGGGDF